MFINLDKLLFAAVLKYRDTFEKVITKSLKYQIKLTKDVAQLKKIKINVIKNGENFTRNIFMLGYHNKSEEIFRWFNSMNEIALKHIQRHNIKDIFGSDTTIKKLFQPEIEISNKYHYVIPYLVAIFNPAYNIVRFEHGDTYVYAMIQLNIVNNFDFDDFVNEMTLYRIASSIKDIKPSILF